MMYSEGETHPDQGPGMLSFIYIYNEYIYGETLEVRGNLESQ